MSKNVMEGCVYIIKKKPHFLIYVDDYGCVESSTIEVNLESLVKGSDDE